MRGARRAAPEGRHLHHGRDDAPATEVCFDPSELGVLGRELPTDDDGEVCVVPSALGLFGSYLPIDVLRGLVTGGDDDAPDTPAPSAEPPSPAPSPAPALLTLQAQLDEVYPFRSRASDGIMADARHIAEGKSDHILGNAFDVTEDPVHGPDLAVLAVTLLQDLRAHYTIWNREIRNIEIQDGAARPYTGADPHTSHVHISIYPASRDDTSLWDLSGTQRAPDVSGSDATASMDAAPATTAAATPATAASSGQRGGGGAILFGALVSILGTVWWASRDQPVTASPWSRPRTPDVLRQVRARRAV
jgi:hypothetical protein